MYKSAAPEYQEVGPFSYKEINKYSDIKYGQKLKDPKNGATLDAVTATLTQELQYLSNNSTQELMDAPMYFANQASLSYWHSQINQKPKWKTQAQLVYQTVVKELGQLTLDLSVFNRMSRYVFTSKNAINKKLLPENPVSREVEKQLFDDPNYGLGDQANFVVWNALNSDADPLEKIAWEWELRTYFGLNFAQVQEMDKNWNAYYQEHLNAIIAKLPILNSDAYENVEGAAYWQWADAMLTQDSFSKQSVVALDNKAFKGFPEFSHFKTNQFDVKASYKNKIGPLADVDFSKKLFRPGFENLFSTSDGGQKFNPPTSSLLNLGNMRTLCRLGASVPNILKDRQEEYGVSFMLTPEWQSLAETLELPDMRYVYMIWLWMETLYDDTLELKRLRQVSDQIDLLSKRGSESLKQTVTTMRLEVPLLTLAEELASKCDGLKCKQIYTDIFALTEEQTERLCTQTEHFTFADRFNSSFALVNVYLYGNTFNPQYYDEFAWAVWSTGSNSFGSGNTYYDPSLQVLASQELPLFQPPDWYEGPETATTDQQESSGKTLSQLQKDQSSEEILIFSQGPTQSDFKMAVTPVEDDDSSSLLPNFQTFEKALVKQFTEEFMDMYEQKYPPQILALPEPKRLFEIGKLNEETTSPTTEDFKSAVVPKAGQTALQKPIIPTPQPKEEKSVKTVEISEPKAETKGQSLPSEMYSTSKAAAKQPEPVMPQASKTFPSKILPPRQEPLESKQAQAELPLPPTSAKEQTETSQPQPQKTKEKIVKELPADQKATSPIVKTTEEKKISQPEKKSAEPSVSAPEFKQTLPTVEPQAATDSSPWGKLIDEEGALTKDVSGLTKDVSELTKDVSTLIKEIESDQKQLVTPSTPVEKRGLSKVPSQEKSDTQVPSKPIQDKKRVDPSETSVKEVQPFTSKAVEQPEQVMPKVPTTTPVKAEIQKQEPTKVVQKVSSQDQPSEMKESTEQQKTKEKIVKEIPADLKATSPIVKTAMEKTPEKAIAQPEIQAPKVIEPVAQAPANIQDPAVTEPIAPELGKTSPTVEPQTSPKSSPWSKLIDKEVTPTKDISKSELKQVTPLTPQEKKDLPIKIEPKAPSIEKAVTQISPKPIQETKDVKPSEPDLKEMPQTPLGKSPKPEAPVAVAQPTSPVQVEKEKGKAQTKVSEEAYLREMPQTSKKVPVEKSQKPEVPVAKAPVKPKETVTSKRELTEVEQTKSTGADKTQKSVWSKLVEPSIEAPSAEISTPEPVKVSQPQETLSESKAPILDEQETSPEVAKSTTPVLGEKETSQEVATPTTPVKDEKSPSIAAKAEAKPSPQPLTVSKSTLSEPEKVPEKTQSPPIMPSSPSVEKSVSKNETLSESPWTKIASTPAQPIVVPSEKPVLVKNETAEYPVSPVDVSTDKDLEDESLTVLNTTKNQTLYSPVPVVANSTSPKVVAFASHLTKNFPKLMYGPDSAFELTMSALQRDFYANFTAAKSICGNQISDLNICSFSNLTYNQWLNGSLLRRGSVKGQKLDRGYVNVYNGYSQLTISPELDSFAEKSGMQVPPQAGVSLAYENFRNMAAYDPLYYQQSIVKKSLRKDTGPMDDYLQFVAVNFGLNGGAFIKRSPREMIEGYQDELVSDLQKRSIFEDGDARPDAFVQLGRQRSFPKENNTVAMLSGKDFKDQTRRVALWTNSSSIVMPQRQFETPTTVTTEMVSPFQQSPEDSKGVTLDGTDGLQFAPEADSNSQLSYYSSEWARNVYFDFISQTDRFKNIKTIKYAVSDDIWKANEKFDSLINGTMNVTSVFGANSVVTRGRYFGLDPSVDFMLPKILNTTGQPMEPECADTDDTLMGVEPYTGIPVVWKQRSFYNMVVSDTELLGSEKAQFVPLVTIKREFEWRQEDIDAELAPLISSQRWKWSLFGALIMIGILSILVAIVMFVKARNLSKKMVGQLQTD